MTYCSASFTLFFFERFFAPFFPGFPGCGLAGGDTFDFLGKGGGKERAPSSTRQLRRVHAPGTTITSGDGQELKGATLGTGKDGKGGGSPWSTPVACTGTPLW